MSRILQWMFFALIIRPVVYILLGLNVRDWQNLPANGPAIIAANHNSHLDTLVLMSMFPLKMLPRLRPVAAEDYFLSNPLFAWFATHIIGIVPVSRTGNSDNPLLGCFDALDRNEILIIFPEGTRGEAEKSTGAFRKGVALLAEYKPTAKVVPVALHGLGKIFPKGAYIPLPFCCDVFVGAQISFTGSMEIFMAELTGFFENVFDEQNFPEWN